MRFTFDSHASPLWFWFTTPSMIALISSTEHTSEKASKSSFFLNGNLLNVSATIFSTPGL